MVGYLLRTLPVAIRARRHAGSTTVSRLARRVEPGQVDVNLHMNQAAYAQVMELGRVDWMFRSGAWARWRADGVKPIVVEQHITYRRELKPLAAYVVESRLVGVDGRLARFAHHLRVEDRVHALGQVKALMVGPGGVLDADAVAAACAGLIAEGPTVSDWRIVGP